METYLTKKYSSLLDIEDVESLFETLKQIYGSIGKAADRCGVARSTAYRWETAKYVKSITKIKILEASLKEKLVETLSFLSNKSKERTSDLLLTYLSSIYQKALRETPENFPNLLLQFANARQNHFGLIQDTLQDEINSMMSILAEKAVEFQVSFPQDSLDMIKPSYLLKIIPDLMHEMFVEKIKMSEIVNRYHVPLEVPTTLENAWSAVIQSFGTTFAQQTQPQRLWVTTKLLTYKSHEVQKEWKNLKELTGVHTGPMHKYIAKPKSLTANANPYIHAKPLVEPQHVA